jgi:ketosteroid isomerase-like protein
MMSKSTDVSLEDRATLEAIIYEHNWRSDHGLQETVVDFYEENCVMTGVANIVGRQAILERARQVPADLQQRHVTTNVRLTLLDDGTVQATSYLTAYRHRGDGAQDNVPSAFIEDTSILHRGADGRWRFMKRHDAVIFQSGGPPTTPATPSPHD